MEISYLTPLLHRIHGVIDDASLAVSRVEKFAREFGIGLDSIGTRTDWGVVRIERACGVCRILLVDDEDRRSFFECSREQKLAIATSLPDIVNQLQEELARYAEISIKAGVASRDILRTVPEVKD